MANITLPSTTLQQTISSLTNVTLANSEGNSNNSIAYITNTSAPTLTMGLENLKATAFMTSTTISSRIQLQWDTDEKIRTGGVITTSSTLESVFLRNKSAVRDGIFKVNGTGHFMDEENEADWYDLQTLFAACFATLVLLMMSVSTVFAIRFLWKKYKKRRDDAKYDGMINRDETNDSLGKPLHSHLLEAERDPRETTNLDLCTNGIQFCEGSTNSCSQNRSNHSSINGSIITMTMKNNHLIVETEERNDLEEDSRETTMRYSPSARDGVFVVEVQQGSRKSPTSIMPSPTTVKTEITSDIRVDITSDQCAVIHHPPDNENQPQEENETPEYMETTSLQSTLPKISQKTPIPTQFGLTQSNSSLAQTSYSYTNQSAYDHGNYGYPVYNGYVNEEPLKKLPSLNKPKITAAVYKNPGQENLEITPDNYLLSDLAVRELANQNKRITEGLETNENDNTSKTTADELNQNHEKFTSIDDKKNNLNEVEKNRNSEIDEKVKNNGNLTCGPKILPSNENTLELTQIIGSSS